MAPAAASLREATPADLPALLRMVRQFAAQVNLPMTASDDDLRAALFGTPPRINAVLAEIAGEAVGLAIWLPTYSTFAGRPNLYIEDIFVEPARRGQGIGRAFFRYLAQRARADGCARMEWSVLNRNKPAQAFYRSLGAAPVNDWTVQRLAGDALAALAAQEDGPHG